MRLEFTESFGGPFRNFEEGASESAGVTEALKQNYVIDRKRKKRVSFACKIRKAILDGGIYDWFAIELVRDALFVPLEEVLVDAVVVVEQFQCRFETLCQSVERVPIQALVVNALNFEDDAQVAGLGEENMGIDEPVEVHLFIE